MARTYRHISTREPRSAPRRRVAAELVALAITVWAAPASAHPRDRRVFVVPSSIDTTGHTDVTGALQQFLAGQTGNGAIIEFPVGATYRLDGTLHLSHRHDLVVDGNGARFVAHGRGDRRRSQWVVRSSDDITLRDMTVVGANRHAGLADDAYVAALEGQHGVELDGVRDVELDHVRISDTFGDLVYIGRDPRSRAWSEGVRVHDSVLVGSGRMGVTVTAGRDIRIDHDVISQTRRSTIDLEPNSRSEGAQRITIANNVIGPGRLFFVAAGKSAGAGNDDVSGLIVEDNALRGHALNVVIDARASRGQRRADVRVVGNVSDVPSYGDPPLRFRHVDGVLVRGNRAPIRFQAVSERDCTHVVVAGNHFRL